jgi:hypothetical protein
MLSPYPDSGGGGAKPPHPTNSEIRNGLDNTLPPDLQYLINELKYWAKANKRDAIRDAIAFWSLKLPAMISAASSGVWAYLDLPIVSVISGAIASLCVIMDGVHPRGMLRNTHLRAVHDLRNLVAKMMTQWRTRNRQAKEFTVISRIISEAEPERQRIAKYLRDAETSLENSQP